MRRLTTTFLIALLLLASLPVAAQDDGGGIFGRIAGAINSAVSSASSAASSFVSSAVDTAQDTYRSASRSVSSAVDRAVDTAKDTYDRASGSANAALDRAGSSFNNAVDRARDTAKDTYDRASGSAKAALDRASSGLSSAVDSAGSSVNRAVDRARDTAKGYYDSAGGSADAALRDASGMTRRFGQQASDSANAAVDRAGSSFDTAMEKAASVSRRFGQGAKDSASAALDRAGSGINSAVASVAGTAGRIGQGARDSANTALEQAREDFNSDMGDMSRVTRELGKRASDSASSMLQRAGYDSFDEIMEGAKGVAGKTAQTAGETIDAVSRRAARPVRTILQRVEEHIAQTSPGAAQAVRAAFKMAEIDSLGDLTSIHTAARLMQVMDAQTLLELTETYGADAVEEAREMIAQIPAEELLMTVGLMKRPLTAAVVRQAHEAARLVDVVCGEENTYFVLRIDGSLLPGKVEFVVDTVGDAVISQVVPLPVPQSLLNVMVWEVAPTVGFGAAKFKLHLIPFVGAGLVLGETGDKVHKTLTEWQKEQKDLAIEDYSPVDISSRPRAAPVLTLFQARHSPGGKVVYTVDFDLSDGFNGDSPDLDIPPRPVCM